MGNYVVQSGSVRRIVQADDARKAAIWTVHLAMEHQLPSGDGLESSSIRDGKLGRNIRVLRADGLEAGCWPIYEILVEWNQLLVALRRLETMLDQDTTAQACSENPTHSGGSAKSENSSSVDTAAHPTNRLGSRTPVATPESLEPTQSSKSSQKAPVKGGRPHSRKLAAA